MQAKHSLEETKAIAQAIRKDALIQTYHAKSGHPGGPLSAADYSAVLWFRHLRYDVENPDWDGRDRYILSNGHCSAMLYSLLARAGYIEQKELLTFRRIGSPLQGHPNRLKVKGIEASTGSLGHGLSLAHGMALAAKKRGQTQVNVYVNLGDGELQEGTCWEAIMAAGHYKTDNLIAMVDFNNAQIDGYVEKVMGIEPLADKFAAFRWRVIEADGHDFDAIEAAFTEAKARNGKPTVILFKTKMMFGTTSFVDDPGWHGKPLNEEQMTIALKELGYALSPEEAVKQYETEQA